MTLEFLFNSKLKVPIFTVFEMCKITRYYTTYFDIFILVIVSEIGIDKNKFSLKPVIHCIQSEFMFHCKLRKFETDPVLCTLYIVYLKNLIFERGKCTMNEQPKDFIDWYHDIASAFLTQFQYKMFWVKASWSMKVKSTLIYRYYKERSLRGEKVYEDENANHCSYHLLSKILPITVCFCLLL